MTDTNYEHANLYKDKKGHWPANQIRFTKEQIVWLIPLLPMLRDGVYPRSPTETGYTDAPISKRQIKKQAGFVVPAEIAAELDKRLTNAGLDGLLLEMVYSQEYPDIPFFEQHIAVALRTDIDNIDQRIKNALAWCCGWRCKLGSYRRYEIEHKSYIKKRGKPS